MPDHVIALDQGTTSTRAIVFDRTGASVGSAQQEHQQIYDAIRLGNPRTARAAAQLHINNTAKRLASAFPTAD